ncbi:hypothetical protein DFJ73DRAFT_35726 [Zopfochytrium polystomum]|nr:hypothetical protein DFJ73DRAFT_35726 [Zopfochytrium polystomum]
MMGKSLKKKPSTTAAATADAADAADRGGAQPPPSHPPPPPLPTTTATTGGGDTATANAPFSPPRENHRQEKPTRSEPEPEQQQRQQPARPALPPGALFKGPPRKPPRPYSESSSTKSSKAKKRQTDSSDSLKQPKSTSSEPLSSASPQAAAAREANNSGSDASSLAGATIFTASSIETVNKRIRSLRKRLTRLEGYESVPRSDLNKDQVDALEKKPEVLAVIKELEEITKLFQKAQSEEIIATKARLKSEAEERNAQVSAAVDRVKAKATSDSRETLDLIFTLTARLPWTRVPLTEDTYAALHLLKTALINPSDSLSRDDFLASTEATLKKYRSGSKEVFAKNVTYAQLKSAVAQILFPPAPPKFGIATDLSNDAAGAPIAQETEAKVDRSLEPHRTLPTKLTFQRRSMILDLLTKLPTT